MKRAILVLTVTVLFSSATPVRASHNLDFADTQNPSPSVQMYIVDSPDNNLNPSQSLAPSSSSSSSADNVIPTDNVFGVVTGWYMALWFLG